MGPCVQRLFGKIKSTSHRARTQTALPALLHASPVRCTFKTGSALSPLGMSHSRLLGSLPRGAGLRRHRKGITSENLRDSHIQRNSGALPLVKRGDRIVIVSWRCATKGKRTPGQIEARHSISPERDVHRLIESIVTFAQIINH